MFRVLCLLVFNIISCIYILLYCGLIIDGCEFINYNMGS